MLGQGRPLRRQFLLTICKPLLCLATPLSALGVCLLCSIALGCLGFNQQLTVAQVLQPAPTSDSENRLGPAALPEPAEPVLSALESDNLVGLRISWGGGNETRWKCWIESSSGPIQKIMPLGLSPDTPGSMYVDQGIAIVDQPTAGVYNGIELFVEIQPACELSIKMIDSDQPSTQFQKTIRLADLASGNISIPIDDRNNRLNIARAPGDDLKVSFDREHLVFWQDDQFTVNVQPHLTGMPTRIVRCAASIVPARSGGPAVWSDELDFELDASGSGAAQQLSFKMPEAEGVYDLVLQLEPRVNAPLRPQTLITRKIQFVCLSKEAAKSNGQLWREQAVLDPSSSRTLIGFQWTKLLKNAGLKQVPSSHSKRTVVTHGNQRMVELGPGGWQAISLPANQNGEPVLIQVEYVAEENIQMGLSVLQPNRKGELPSYGFDSGVVVPKSFGSTGDSPSKIQRHQIVFWPQSNQPYLVVSNRDKTMPLKFSTIRVLSGPNRLAPDNHVPDPELRDRTRQLLSFFDSPMFPENFGAEEVFDSTSGQTLDDWKTFYDGADRLIQHLKANGYSGTILTVAADSGTIYPSELLQPTPIFDSGRFFATGQDPIPKDILEMLFRMFDREGLTLVPGLSLSGPIPGLETQIRGGERGLRPVDFRGRPAPWASDTPIYSALNSQVQQAVVDVVDEMTNRYSHHNCFKGVSIICRPKTYTQLGGRRWGYDSPTVTRFLDDSGGVQLVAGVANDWTQIQNLLLGSNHKQWFAWRAKQIGSWYDKLHRTVSKNGAQRRLYLAPIDIYRHPDIVSSLSPSLHWSNQFEEAMLELGWAPELWPENPSIVLLKPNRIDHNGSLSSNKIEYQTRHANQESEFYRNKTITGELFLHRTFWSDFLERDEIAAPNGQSGKMLRLQQLTPSHWHNRKRFIESLHDLDSRLMVDGGWLMAQGQEASMVDLVDVYTRLPDIPFDTVASTRQAMNSGPIVVRQAIADGRWYLYCLNDSPWQVKTRIQFNRIGVGELESLSLNEIQVQEDEDGTQFIELVMQPYSVVAGFSTEAAAQAVDFSFEVDPSAAEAMRKRLNQLQLRMIQAAKVKPTGAIANSEFDFNNPDELPDWTFDNTKADEFSLRREESENAALRMRSNSGSNWIRSNSFAVPDTGRLSISVWLRSDDEQNQPPLRIAVESDQGDYYRFGTIGSLSPDDPVNQVGATWRQYVVHFDDLPLDSDSQLRVGFDMMGEGEVWIDRVQTYDRLFDSNDIQALTQLLGTARPLIENQTDYDVCRRMLNGYWLRFLFEYIGQENEPLPADPIAGEIIFQEQPAARTSSIMERFRKIVPRRRRR